MGVSGANGRSGRMQGNAPSLPNELGRAVQEEATLNLLPRIVGSHDSGAHEIELLVRGHG